jgi:phytoene desaturase (3,4-didehydrolycopene-forming)
LSYIPVIAKQVVSVCLFFFSRVRGALFPFFSCLLEWKVFAPQGGFQAVTDALQDLAKASGVDVQCGKTVTSIQNEGVYLHDTDSSPPSGTEFLPADLVVVNADLPYATKSLLSLTESQSQKATQEGHSLFDWDDQFSFSSGVISFHWSVDKVLEDLNTHNVFLVAGSRSQAEASWQVLRSNIGDVDDDTPFNFYVHRASQTDPTAAPKGCDSVTILVPCRTLMRDAECANLPREEAMQHYKEQFSEEVVSNARDAVLKRLAAVESLRNLNDHILEEVVDTPATWADQYNLAAGSSFALVRTY